MLFCRLGKGAERDIDDFAAIRDDFESDCGVEERICFV